MLQDMFRMVSFLSPAEHVSRICVYVHSIVAAALAVNDEIMHLWSFLIHGASHSFSFLAAV